MNHDFDDVASGTSSLSWERARDAARDGWNRISP